MKDINEGQSMFELLVAVSITALILLGLISLSTVSVKNTSTSAGNSAATRYAQEAMEFIRNERDNNWTAFSGRSLTSGSVYCFNTSPPNWSTNNLCNTSQVITGTNYRRNVTLTTRSDNRIIDVGISVSWDTAQGENSVTISSTLTNWKK